MTQQERQAHDLGRLHWNGPVHAENVEAVAMALDRMLRGSRFTLTYISQMPRSWPSIETYASQRVRSIEMAHGGDWSGFRIMTGDKGWSLKTKIDGPNGAGYGRIGAPGAPHAWFSRKERSFRWSEGSPDNGFHLVLTVEEDLSSFAVEDVMYA